MGKDNQIKLRGYVLDDPEWLYQVEHMIVIPGKRNRLEKEYIFYCAACSYANPKVPRSTLISTGALYGIPISSLSKFIHGRLGELSRELQKKCEEKLWINYHVKTYTKKNKKRML